MACNTPIIASFDTNSELADVLYESKSGYCVEPDSVESLSHAILEEYYKWRKGENNSLNAREYAILHASKETSIEEYINTLLEVAK